MSDSNTERRSPPVPETACRGATAPRVDRTPAEIFGAAAHLQLLQLETRRKIAERLGKGQAAADEEDVDRPVMRPPRTRVPKKWQLLPKGVRLHRWQKKCLPLWMEKGRGTVKVATGGGKTFFALAAAQELQRKVEPDLRLVIVVPTIPLMIQWRSELRAGNLPDSAIGLLGGSESPASLDNVRVLICVLASARQKLPDLVATAGWADRMLLVVDECHRSRAAQARRIFECGPRYTLGLSATPETADDDDAVPQRDAYDQGVVGQALGPIIYEFSLQECHDAGLLSPFELWHVGVPLDDAERAEHVRLSDEIADLRKPLQALHARLRARQPFLAWCQARAADGGEMAAEAERFMGLANARKRLLYRAKSRAAAVLGILREMLTESASRAIVFHEAIDEIERMFLDLLDASVPAVLEHSKLPDGLRADSIEAFRAGTARAIVSAKSLVEGFNVPSADIGIIAASSGSVRQRIQSLGRLLRRKESGSAARIYVLYVQGTEDEMIYEKADWDQVIGSERNRYFVWNEPMQGTAWSVGLRETGTAPRRYRPPASEVDASKLEPGDSWPAQTHGFTLHVDHADNLRMEDGTLVPVGREVVDRILGTNSFRKATLTPARHVITRTAASHADEQQWVFVTTLDAIPEPAPAVERLKVGTVAGRQQIIRGGRSQRFALAPEAARDPDAGAARNALLSWINDLEPSHRKSVTHLFWDGKQSYWVELKGEKIPFPGQLGPLEFPA